MLSPKQLGLVTVLVLALVLVPVSLNYPRGIRRKNPGNIRVTGTKWKGSIAKPGDEFEAYATSQYGLRSAARVLKNYKDRHGIDTVQGVSLLWAPASENNSAEHAQTVAQVAGLTTQQTIDLDDQATAAKVLKGIVQAENGTNMGRPWYSDAEIKTAVAAAFA